jgi:hypothetical protein
MAKVFVGLNDAGQISYSIETLDQPAGTIEAPEGITVQQLIAEGWCYIQGAWRRLGAAPSSFHVPTLKGWSLDDPGAIAIFEAARERARVSINKAAEAARLRYRTGGYGQDAVYAIKETEARTWQATSFAGPVPLHIQADAAARGRDPRVVAEEVICAADRWALSLSPSIEGARQKGLEAVRQCSVAAELDGVVREARQALSLL